MRELLRVAMNMKQLHEACAQWARARTNSGNETVAQAQITLDEKGAPIGAEVIFLKKRERKPKAPASEPAGPSTF